MISRQGLNFHNRVLRVACGFESRVRVLKDGSIWGFQNVVSSLGYVSNKALKLSPGHSLGFEVGFPKHGFNTALQPPTKVRI